jgi:hypothetical protein
VNELYVIHIRMVIKIYWLLISLCVLKQQGLL